MTLELLDEITRRLRAGEAVALCVVTGVRGSTPQVVGAKMLVLGNGRSIGTLGGGCVEAEVRKRALDRLITVPLGNPSQISEPMSFQLDNDLGWDDGMICGGGLDVHVTVLRDALEAERFAGIAEAVRAGRPVEFTIPEIGYREQVAPPPALILAGAGHVSQAVAALAASLDFRVTVIDDRAEFASEARFPTARHRVVGEIDLELARQTIDPDTYIVIATRGHARDGAALAAVVNSPARYIGMVGSGKKVRTIFAALANGGVDPVRLARVRAPIGLDLGAVTVQEIAVSIAAEMIAVRRGASPPIPAMMLAADPPGG